MDHIGALLPKVLKKRGLQSHADATLILAKATEWIALNLPETAADLRPIQMKDRVLHITCNHSIASQECQQRSLELLSYLQESCPGIPLEQIRLVRSEGRP